MLGCADAFPVPAFAHTSGDSGKFRFAGRGRPGSQGCRASCPAAPTNQRGAALIVKLRCARRRLRPQWRAMSQPGRGSVGASEPRSACGCSMLWQRFSSVAPAATRIDNGGHVPSKSRKAAALLLRSAHARVIPPFGCHIPDVAWHGLGEVLRSWAPTGSRYS